MRDLSNPHDEIINGSALPASVLLASVHMPVVSGRRG
jgi:hypothetical protein